MKVALWFFGCVLAAGLVFQFNGVQDIPALVPKGPLGKLVTYRQALELDAFYGAMAAAVGDSSLIETTGEFRRLQKRAVKILQDGNADLMGIEKLNDPIEKRLIAAIGRDGTIPDEELSPPLRARLVSALKRISEDF